MAFNPTFLLPGKSVQSRDPRQWKQEKCSPKHWLHQCGSVRNDSFPLCSTQLLHLHPVLAQFLNTVLQILAYWVGLYIELWFLSEPHRWIHDSGPCLSQSPSEGIHWINIIKSCILYTVIAFCPPYSAIVFRYEK